MSSSNTVRNMWVLDKTGDDLPGRTGVRQARFFVGLNAVG